MRPILTLEDLEVATKEEKVAAASALNLKGRVEAGLARRGTERGLTLEEYNERLAEIVACPIICPTCHGVGDLKAKAPRIVGCIHPSSATYCVLQLYHDVVGDWVPVKRQPPELVLTLLIGTALHEAVQGILREDLGERFRDEVRIEIGDLVRGNTDGLITLPEARAVLEIKSIGKEFDNLRAPLPEHRIQAGGLYATALDAPFTVYLYISKYWPHPMREFVEEYDPSLFGRWWRTKGEKVARALDSGKEPMADSSPEDCKECCYEADCTQKLDKKGGRAFQVRPGGR